MWKRWALALLALALVPLNGCPGDAWAEKPKLSLVAVGDTLHARVFFKAQGAADSIIATYQNPRSITQRHKLPGIATSDTASLVPNPALAPGDTTRVTVQLVLWRGPSPNAVANASTLYTRPSGIQIDSFPVSVRFMPQAVFAFAGDDVTVTAVGFDIRGNAVASQSYTFNVGTDPGTTFYNRFTFVAPAGQPPRFLRDSVKVRVYDGGKNEPPGYTAFAIAYMDRIPNWPKGAVAGWMGTWGAFSSDCSKPPRPCGGPNLSIVQDPTVLPHPVTP